MKYANGCGYKWVEGRGQVQVNAFACATTYKRMKELLKEKLGISGSYFEGYWSKCGNDRMMAIANVKEGVWIASSTQTEDYKEI